MVFPSVVCGASHFLCFDKNEVSAVDVGRSLATLVTVYIGVYTKQRYITRLRPKNVCKGVSS